MKFEANMSTSRMIEVEIPRIIISEINDQQIVYIKEVGGTRQFPLLIGLFEASSIARLFEGNPAPRPRTYEAWFSTISSVGGKVEEIAVVRYEDYIYYAEVRIQIDGKRVAIDTRPSDAIAIAILANAPIYIKEDVLDEVAS